MLLLLECQQLQSYKQNPIVTHSAVSVVTDDVVSSLIDKIGYWKFANRILSKFFSSRSCTSGTSLLSIMPMDLQIYLESYQTAEASSHAHLQAHSLITALDCLIMSIYQWVGRSLLTSYENFRLSPLANCMRSQLSDETISYVTTQLCDVSPFTSSPTGSSSVTDQSPAESTDMRTSQCAPSCDSPGRTSSCPKPEASSNVHSQPDAKIKTYPNSEIVVDSVLSMAFFMFLSRTTERQVMVHHAFLLFACRK